MTEIVPDRLWRVKYEFVMASMLTPEGKQQAKAFGTDPEDPDYAPRVLSGAQQFGEKAVEVAHQDIARAVDLFSNESLTESELIDIAGWNINSFIVKLKNGNLLLYAPVKIRDETGFADWVNSLGRQLFCLSMTVVSKIFLDSLSRQNSYSSHQKVRWSGLSSRQERTL